MITSVLLSFIEGLALIFSPCILPILPLVLSTSINGGRRRPFGIILGFILSFSLFALISRQLVVIFNINLDYIKYASLVLLTMFGFILLFDRLSLIFERYTSKLANLGVVLPNNHQDGFLSGVLIGALISLVWTPCAGPILASALVQIIREQRDFNAMLLIFAFSFGAGIPMFIISLTGRKILTKLHWLKKRNWLVNKILGIIILLSVGFIGSGVNATDLISTNNKLTASSTANKLQDPLLNPYPAANFAKSNIWLNTPNNQALDMQKLRGKVVLVDFWTYSCINCLRTIPDMVGLDKKYSKYGLVIVGVHSPEFEFEKNANNVKNALSRYGIKYPVAMDNNLDTWTNYNNQYWPAHYLIDKNGMVVYTHFGEGQADELDNNIRVLLGLGGKVSSDSPQPDFFIGQTPETYLGYTRADNFSSPEMVVQNSLANYILPNFLSANNWALKGSWQINNQDVVTGSGDSKLQLNFTAKHVYLVLGSATNLPIKVNVKLNGSSVLKEAGSDVVAGVVTVTNHRLYELINQNSVKNSLLELSTNESGLEAYAFTFGS
jgi:cytochrome c biogenesis protein CcdA/thiol-disulfide isomerase/thioredoxin